MKKTILWPLWVPMIVVCMLAWGACGETASENENGGSSLAARVAEEVEPIPYNFSNQYICKRGEGCTANYLDGTSPPDDTTCSQTTTCKCCRTEIPLPFEFDFSEAPTFEKCTVGINLTSNLPGVQNCGKNCRDNDCLVDPVQMMPPSIQVLGLTGLTNSDSIENREFNFRDQCNKKSGTVSNDGVVLEVLLGDYAHHPSTADSPGHWEQDIDVTLILPREAHNKSKGSICIILETMDPCLFCPKVSVDSVKFTFLPTKQSPGTSDTALNPPILVNDTCPPC